MNEKIVCLYLGWMIMVVACKFANLQRPRLLLVFPSCLLVVNIEFVLSNAQQQQKLIAGQEE